MNKDLDKLQPYPFEKLKALKACVNPPESLSHIPLSIGEPKHEAPRFVIQTLIDNIDKLSNYPTTKGLPELRTAIADWAEQRFKLADIPLDAERHVLPVNGTREALFAFAQAVVDRGQTGAQGDLPLVLSPNPFYQIYEGAALLAGAEPAYLPCDESRGFIPDFDAVSDEQWQHCQLLFLCSPGNPTGAVIDSQTLKKLITLADKFDFIIASDECYSELYFDESKPPVGLLQVCAELERSDFSRCVVFHSLSKRSNLPGLRSGFVAGCGETIQKFLLYRTYHGCAMPVQHQLASISAWQDEQHVLANRDLYRAKFDAVLAELDGCLDVQKPDASFYLWAATPIADTDFAQQLFASQHITVLPGSFIGREQIAGEPASNPGSNRIRMALVAPLDQCIEAARRIRKFVQELPQC